MSLHTPSRLLASAVVPTSTSASTTLIHPPESWSRTWRDGISRNDTTRHDTTLQYEAESSGCGKSCPRPDTGFVDVLRAVLAAAIVTHLSPPCCRAFLMPTCCEGGKGRRATCDVRFPESTDLSHFVHMAIRPWSVEHASILQGRTWGRLPLLGEWQALDIATPCSRQRHFNNI